MDSEFVIDGATSLAKKMGHSPVLAGHVLLYLASQGVEIPPAVRASADSQVARVARSFDSPTMESDLKAICRSGAASPVSELVPALSALVSAESASEIQVPPVPKVRETAKPAAPQVPEVVKVNMDFEDVVTQLKQRVQGQDHAIDALVNRLAVFAREFDARPERPNGVFLFAGPTGVGKTELARGLAEALYGSEDHLIRIDMSEYYHPAEISRLIGSAPGYVGYDQPDSWITTQIIAKPRCVLLLDEVEKAHPQVWNTFLQVFDAGLLTDGRGQRAEFRDVVIIMTTNIGAEFFGKNPFGLSPVAGDISAESSVVTEIKSAFRPELFNRIDEVMIFQPLTAETVRLIAESQLREAAVRLRDLGYHFEVSNDLVVWLAKLGYDPVYGARPLLRVIEEKVLAPLALRAPGTFQHKIENDELTWQ